MATPGVLTVSQLGDVRAGTLSELNRLKYTDISPSLTKYVGMRSLFQKDRITVSGQSIKWSVNTEDSDAAQNVGMAATDVVNVRDGWVTAEAPWRGSTVNYAIDGMEESINAAGPNRIQDLRRQRRDMALKSLAYLMEANWWQPPLASTDTLAPWGINTWIAKSSTAGFTGAMPSGWSDLAGLSTTIYAGWKNYAAPYTLLSKADGVRAWRLAAYATDFQPPIDGQPLLGTGNDYAFFLNRATIMTLEELLEAQNDDLGSDIDSQYNKPAFRSQPCTYVPYLDADTTNPIYGINFGWFKTYILNGWWLKETHIANYPEQHTLAAWFIDLRYQIVCLNRRVNFVISTGTTYPS